MNPNILGPESVCIRTIVLGTLRETEACRGVGPFPGTVSWKRAWDKGENKSYQRKGLTPRVLLALSLRVPTHGVPTAWVYS